MGLEADDLSTARHPCPTGSVEAVGSLRTLSAGEGLQPQEFGRRALQVLSPPCKVFFSWLSTQWQCTSSQCCPCAQGIAAFGSLPKPDQTVE